MDNLKLDYKKTSKVGLAFAIIIMFWNTYDFVIPLLIENAYGLSNAGRGAVMGLDNLLSLFMLPWFGKLSDKCTSKWGRRTPFIALGTIAAVVLMVFVPITANNQLRQANVIREDSQTAFATDAAFRTTELAKWYDMAENGEYDYISKMDYKIITGVDKRASDDRLTAEQYAALNYTETYKVTKGGIFGFFGDNYYLLKEVDSAKIDGQTYYYYTDGVEYDKKKDTYTKNGVVVSIDDIKIDLETEAISKAEYDAISATNTLYNKYVKPGVAEYISTKISTETDGRTGSLVAFLVVLFLVLVAMGTFRSPAVALMPDVTPKPLRSQANAIINLAGGVGGAISFLIYTIVLGKWDYAYILVYAMVAFFMLALLALFKLLVNEPKFVDEKNKICEEFGITDDDDEADALKQQEQMDGLAVDVISANADTSEVAEADAAIIAEEKKKLEKAKFRSFLFILGSIFMWFMGYNAVTSNLSVYATKALGMSAGTAGLISGISMGISAIAFIPVGMLAVKIGRRKSIILGFALAIVSYTLIYLFLTPGNTAAIFFTVFYLIAGFGTIIANVNTFPMVVELSRAEDVGKYTGYYYMATMSAQAITPFIAGLFMDSISIKALFAYSVVCIIASIALMMCVKHGDSRPLPKKKVYEMMEDAD